MLVYDQPINRARPGRRAATRAPAGFDLFALFSVLWRRKGLITAAQAMFSAEAMIRPFRRHNTLNSANKSKPAGTRVAARLPGLALFIGWS